MPSFQADRATVPTAPNTTVQNNVSQSGDSILSRMGRLSLSAQIPTGSRGTQTDPAPAPAPAISQSTQIANEQSYFQDQQSAKIQQIIQLIDPKAAPVAVPDGATSLQKLQGELSSLAKEITTYPVLTSYLASSNPAIGAFLSNPTATDAAGFKNVDGTLAALQGIYSVSPDPQRPADALTLQSLRKDLGGINADQAQDQLAKNGLEPLFKQLFPTTDIQGTSQADRDSFILKTIQTSLLQGDTYRNLAGTSDGQSLSNFLNAKSFDGLSNDSINAVEIYAGNQQILNPNNKDLGSAVTTFALLGNGLIQTRADLQAPPTLVSRTDQAAYESASFVDNETTKLQSILKVIDPKAAAEVTFPAGATSEQKLTAVLTSLSTELASNPALTNLAASTDPAVRAYFKNPTATTPDGLSNLATTLGYLEGSYTSSPVAQRQQDGTTLGPLITDFNNIRKGQAADLFGKDVLEPLATALFPNQQITGTTQAQRNASVLSEFQSAISSSSLTNPGGQPINQYIAQFLKETNLTTISNNTIAALGYYAIELLKSGTPYTDGTAGAIVSATKELSDLQKVIYGDQQG